MHAIHVHYYTTDVVAEVPLQQCLAKLTEFLRDEFDGILLKKKKAADNLREVPIIGEAWQRYTRQPKTFGKCQLLQKHGKGVVGKHNIERPSEIYIIFACAKCHLFRDTRGKSAFRKRLRTSNWSCHYRLHTTNVICGT